MVRTLAARAEQSETSLLWPASMAAYALLAPNVACTATGDGIQGKKGCRAYNPMRRTAETVTEMLQSLRFELLLYERTQEICDMQSGRMSG